MRRLAQVAAFEDLVDVGFEPDQLVQLPPVHGHHAIHQLRAVPAAKRSLQKANRSSCCEQSSTEKGALRSRRVYDDEAVFDERAVLPETLPILDALPKCRAEQIQQSPYFDLS
jgi:Uma2 family endonuclease